MSTGQKKTLWRIALSGVLLVVGMLLYKTSWWGVVCYLAAYLIIGYDVVKNAAWGIFRGQVFDESFLMTIATIGAIAIGEYPEAVGIMLFYQVGEFFQSYAVGKSRESISDLMDIYPEYANIYRNSQLVQVDPQEVVVGDEIVVLAGEKIPLDGVVVGGSSSVDTSALSGEAVPRMLNEGDDAISGCINLTGTLTIRVTKEFSSSTVAQILDLVENASSKKANVEKFITRFSRYYTPIVVISALLLVMLPPLLTGAPFAEWIRRGVNFLIVSCPCALLVSVPLSFFGGIGAASKQGVLVKGSNYLEQLSQVKAMVFDKTGTLTEGVFEVVEVCSYNEYTKEQLVETVAYVEYFSNHPISHSLKKAYGQEIDSTRVDGFEDIAGKGIKSMVDGTAFYAGNTKLMDSLGVDYHPQHQIGTVVHVATGEQYLGHIVIADRIKEASPGVISALNEQGIETVMLTGDAKAVATEVAAALGIQTVYSDLLPVDKVDKLEELLQKYHSFGNAKVAFAGDGINDAPVLTRADIGISMGALGSDAAIEASDIVLMDDNPEKILDAIAISKNTVLIAKQNIVFALTVKMLVLALSLVGLSQTSYAVFADVGVTVIAVLNAMRALQFIRKK